MRNRKLLLALAVAGLAFTTGVGGRYLKDKLVKKQACLPENLRNFIPSN
jgi:hypothetical protein